MARRRRRGALELMPPERLAAYAREVEQLGYCALWAGESAPTASSRTSRRSRSCARTNLRALGFADEDFDPATSERLVDALVAAGDADEIQSRIAALRDAGADQVVLLTLDGDPWWEPSLETLRALAAT